MSCCPYLCVCVCWWDGMVGYHRIRLFFDVPSLGMCPSRQSESKWLSEDLCHQCGLWNGTLSSTKRSDFYISSQSSYSQMSVSRSKLKGGINTKLLLFIFSPNRSLWDVCSCDSCSTSVGIWDEEKNCSWLCKLQFCSQMNKQTLKWQAVILIYSYCTFPDFSENQLLLIYIHEPWIILFLSEQPNFLTFFF